MKLTTRMCGAAVSGLVVSTVFAAGLLAQAGARKPEIFDLSLSIQSGVVLPRTLSLTGRGLSRQIQVVDLPLEFKGLTNGRYTVVPLYEGGFRGEAIPIVGAGTPVRLVVPVAPVGGVRLSGINCGGASSLVIEDLSKRSPRRIYSLNPGSELARCSWNLDGLASGTYRALLTGPLGSLGSATLQIQSQRVLTTRLRNPVASISGQIRENGRPFTNSKIQLLQPTGATFRSYLTHTDEAGHYRFDVDALGRHTLRFPEDSKLRSETRSIDIRNGLNRLDWEIAAGSVSVTFQNARATSPVRLFFRSGAQVLTRYVIPKPSGTLVSLPLGTYTAYAAVDTPAGEVSDSAQTFTLSHANSEARIRFSLAQNQSELVVRDAAGNPVVVSVTIDGVSSGLEGFKSSVSALTHKGSGRYSMQGVPAGATLQIRGTANLAPTCITLKGLEPETVVLRTGSPLSLELTTPTTTAQLNAAAGRIRLSEAQTCSVPISQFLSKPLGVAGETRRFTLSNFPDAPVVYWQPFPPQRVGEQRVAVSSDRRLTLRVR